MVTLESFRKALLGITWKQIIIKRQKYLYNKIDNTCENGGMDHLLFFPPICLSTYMAKYTSMCI